MKPEYKLCLTSLFSLEQNDEGSCSTAVGFIQVWSSVGLKPDVMLRLTSPASLQPPPTRRDGTRGPAPVPQPPPRRPPRRPLDASRGTPPQAGEVSLKKRHP